MSARIKRKSETEKSTHMTERSGVAVMMSWMREIIEKKSLYLGAPNVETTHDDRKMPDLVIYTEPESQQILCLIEAKQPAFDVFDEEELKEPARKKATTRGAPYFALTNFRKLIWFDTKAVNAGDREEETILGKFDLSEIENLDQLETSIYSNPTKAALEQFLFQLYEFSTGLAKFKRMPFDEILVNRLQEKVRVLKNLYIPLVAKKCNENREFQKKLTRWFNDQGWTFTAKSAQPSDYEKVARQATYLLINKILFYNLLQSHRPKQLKPLQIPKDLSSGGHLQKSIQAYFDEVLKIDYQSIYETDFIDEVAFPDSQAVCREIYTMVESLKHYDFNIIGFDIMGRTFEKLIPQKERHLLGQYFTNNDVVDLVLEFSSQSPDHNLLDPSCGAGTFLVRAYQNRSLQFVRPDHTKMLNNLWGVDIAKFPAHFAMINLAINNLKTNENYPNILHKDFFELKASHNGNYKQLQNQNHKALQLGTKEHVVEFPTEFDAIVGNPPYTRQEEMNDSGSSKDKTIERALYDLNGEKLANISKRAGLHAYFFVHGTKFLKEKGYFGFVVSNSWLDVDYGKGLQEFFLKYYKIVAVIESKVERWFEQADVNTCIVILQKCSKPEQREENTVRFVQFKKRLSDYFPPLAKELEPMWERKKAYTSFKLMIMSTQTYTDIEESRVFPIKQSLLLQEGTDPDTGKFIGAKWGKYLRAPEIFFKILETAKDRLVPLHRLAQVRFGIKTGANEFFYLTEEQIKKKGIEKEFWMHKDELGEWKPNYLIKSPRECTICKVKPDELRNRVLLVHKPKKQLGKKKILQYIEYGERKDLHKGATCASRNIWYDLGEPVKPDGIWFKAFNERFMAPYTAGKFYTSDRFYSIYVKNREVVEILFYYLNSTITTLLVEINGRVNLGEGALDNMTYEAASMLVLDVEKYKIQLHSSFEKILERPIESIFRELGANVSSEVTLENVKPDRRALDKIIMGDILGLSEEEQLDVYRAVIDLVRARLDKAGSVDRQEKVSEGVNVELFVENTLSSIESPTIAELYKDKVLTRKNLKEVELPARSDNIEIQSDLLDWKLISGRKKIVCDSENEAKFLRVFIECGFSAVMVPTDERLLKALVPVFEKRQKEINEVVEEYLEGVQQPKVKEQLRSAVYAQMNSILIAQIYE